VILNVRFALVGVRWKFPILFISTTKSQSKYPAEILPLLLRKEDWVPMNFLGLLLIGIMLIGINYGVLVVVQDTVPTALSVLEIWSNHSNPSQRA